MEEKQYLLIFSVLLASNMKKGGGGKKLYISSVSIFRENNQGRQR